MNAEREKPRERRFRSVSGLQPGTWLRVRGRRQTAGVFIVDAARGGCEEHVR